MRILAVLLLLAGAGPLSALDKTPLAGGVVRSKEWKVRRGADKEEEFSGDVSYRGEGAAVRADWALYRHASETWRARGGVRVERTLASGETVEAAGDEALYDQKSQKGSLWAARRVTFRRAPAEGPPDEGEAGRVEWTGRDRVLLKGGVHVWGPRLEAWADEAEYERGAAARLALSGGRPVLRKLGGWGPAADDWTGAVKADAITARESPRGISADGKAAGWIVFPKSRAAGRAR